MEDLRTLSQQNVSMDLATFKTLQVDALVVSGEGYSRGRGSREALQKVARSPEKSLWVGGGPLLGRAS